MKGGRLQRSIPLKSFVFYHTMVRRLIPLKKHECRDETDGAEHPQYTTPIITHIEIVTSKKHQTPVSNSDFSGML